MNFWGAPSKPTKRLKPLTPDMLDNAYRNLLERSTERSVHFVIPRRNYLEIESAYRMGQWINYWRKQKPLRVK